MKPISVLLVALALHSTVAQGQDSQAFGAPVFVNAPGGTSRCDEERSQLRVLDDRKSLSFLIVDPFLDVGRTGLPSATATCLFEVPIKDYSKTGRMIQVDIESTATKEPQSELRVSLRMGNQLHRIEYLQGRLLDGASSPERLLRFHLPPSALKGGRLRLQFTGTARTLNGKDQAQLAFGLVSACFVEPETLGACGAATNQGQKK